MGSCPGGESSWWGVVLVGSHSGVELSWWGVILVGSCPGGESSWWGVVPVGNCRDGDAVRLNSYQLDIGLLTFTFLAVSVVTRPYS